MKVVNAEVVNVIEETGQVLVKITIEDDDGYVEEFVMDLWEISDASLFAETLHRWKTYILPRRKKVHNLVKKKGDTQTVQDFIKALKGLKVEATDTPNTVKYKILQKVQNILNKLEQG